MQKKSIQFPGAVALGRKQKITRRNSSEDDALTDESELPKSRVRVRPAVLNDVPFIVALALANGAALHFAVNEGSVIESAVGGRIELNDREGAAHLTVIEECPSKPFGFMISIEYDNLSLGFANELYLLAVDLRSRRKGAGRCLVADAIKRLDSLSKCTLAISTSNASKRLLIGSFGFDVLRETASGTALRRCGRDCPGETAHKTAQTRP